MEILHSEVVPVRPGTAPDYDQNNPVVRLLAMTEAATTESKRVMLLHSFGKEFKPWSEYAKTIREELKRQARQCHPDLRLL